MVGLAPTRESTLAVIFGAGQWPNWPGLDGSEAFAHSAADLKAYLVAETGLGIPKANVFDRFDSDKSPSDLLVEMKDWLEQRVSSLRRSKVQATDLIFYFTGHGTPEDGVYCLLTRYARTNLASATGLTLPALCKTLREGARLVRQYMIIDACFSAQAAKYILQSGSLTTLTEQVRDEFPAKGVALLCSASAKDASKVLAGERHTMFTGALLSALTKGDPRLGSRMSLGAVGQLTQLLIAENTATKGVRPEVHSPDQRDGDVAWLPLFPNPSAANSLSPAPGHDTNRDPSTRISATKSVTPPTTSAGIKASEMELIHPVNSHRRSILWFAASAGAVVFLLIVSLFMGIIPGWHNSPDSSLKSSVGAPIVPERATVAKESVNARDKLLVEHKSIENSSEKAISAADHPDATAALDNRRFTDSSESTLRTTPVNAAAKANRRVWPQVTISAYTRAYADDTTDTPDDLEGFVEKGATGKVIEFSKNKLRCKVSLDKPAGEEVWISRDKLDAEGKPE